MQPSVMATMTEEEKTELASIVEALELEREPLVQFVPRVSPGHIAPTHLTELCNLLDRSRDEKLDVCVSVPPGAGKTDCLLHAIVQRLITYPSQLIGYVTYGDDLSLAKSTEARDIAIRAGLQLRSDTASKREWATTHGGGFKASSIGGSLTGRHLNFVVFDDPFKNRASAESARERDRVHDFFSSTLTTRCLEDASRFVVCARWHDDDLIGRLSRQLDGKWIVVNIPAIADEYGNPADVGRIILEPVRLANGSVFGYSRETLAARRAENEYDWHSLYQGVPRGRGGKVFSADPVRYVDPQLDGARMVLVVDAAGTENTRNDFSVCGAVAFTGYKDEMRADVVDVLREQLTPENFAPKLYAFQQRVAKGASIFIEATRDGKDLKKALELIDSNLRIVTRPAIGDKFLRSQPVASAWNQGRVRVPYHAPWVAPFLYELEKFTGIGDAHDDQVDALALAWAIASEAGEPLKPRTVNVPPRNVM